jgi:hypothetical protein
VVQGQGQTQKRGRCVYADCEGFKGLNVYPLCRIQGLQTLKR